MGLPSEVAGELRKEERAELQHHTHSQSLRWAGSTGGGGVAGLGLRAAARPGEARRRAPGGGLAADFEGKALKELGRNFEL